MKKMASRLMVLCIMSLGAGHIAFADDSAVERSDQEKAAKSADDDSVADRAGKGIKKGGEAASRGIKKGADAAAKGIKKGSKAVVKGVKKGTEWVGKGLKKTGEKLEEAGQE